MPTYQDKKTKKWFFQVNKTIDGKYKQFRRTGFEKKAEALEAERKFLNEFKEIDYNNITMEYLINNFYNKKKYDLKETTYFRFVQRIDKKIKEPLGNIKIKEISNKNISKWKDQINAQKISINYKNRLIFDLKSILEYGIILYNISPKVLLELTPIKNTQEIKKELNFWTIDEFNSFIKVIDDEEKKLIFKTLYYTGLRIGELQALNWHDYYDGKIRVNKTLTNKIKGKGNVIVPPKTINSNREVLLPNFLVNDLDLYKESLKKNKKYSIDNYIFGNETPLSHTSISRWKNYYCKLANVKQIRLHDFRHSHASYLINLGADYMVLSKRLGHSDIAETLNTYAHLYPNKQEIILKLMEKDNKSC